jgi:serine/threonine protein kinase
MVLFRIVFLNEYSDIGAVKWLSPESLQSKQYSQMSDVWSFGCVCFEIINHKDPFPELDAVETTVKVLIEKQHPILPDREQWPVIYEIMRDW